MDIRRVMLYIVLIGIFCQCSPTKGIQFKDGKCYAKCLIQEGGIIHADEYIVYTGNELEEEVDLQVKEIILQEESQKWVKRKADRNCLSSDPNDCIVWCLEKVPEKKETLTILLDTTQSSKYIIKRIEKTVEPGKTFTTLKEVLCEQDLTPSIISKIQKRLKANLYYNGGVSGKLDLVTRKAMKDFQKDNNLPIGHLDLESLDALGVVI